MEKKEEVMVEAIKLSLGRLNAVGISAKEVLEESIKYLCDLYSHTQQVEYLLKARIHIRVYFELGFLCGNNKDLFDTIEGLLEKEGYGTVPFRKYCTKKILVNKSQIRGVLGRWNPKNHSMPINEVVMDIIRKVQKHQIGCYNYWTEQKYGRKRIRLEYELHIREDEAVLYDVQKNYYYELEGG